MSAKDITVYPSTGLNILVVGAGCAGPAFALLLQKTNPKHTITVIERTPSLRTGGQQLDFKGRGLTIVKKLGLLDRFKEVSVKETGMSFVNDKGKPLLSFGINPADETRAQGAGLTNEYEIMRGDIVKVFYDASLAEKESLDKEGGENREGGLEYKFDTTITALEQNKNAVTVTFSNGQTSSYDLVVAADGQNSRTRRMAFDESVNANCFNTLGVHAAYYEIPRIPADGSDAQVHFASDSRVMMTRTGDRNMMQIYLFLMKDKDRHTRMQVVHKQPIQQQKEAWMQLFKDAGWQSERFTEGLKDTKDFYAHEIAQVKVPQHHAGRVVLLGDAGYCPTLFTGMGTTLSSVGAYILAGELAKHGDNVEAALQGYEEMLKEPIEKYQKFPSLANSILYPSSAFGIRMLHFVFCIVSVFRIDKLLRWLSQFFPEEKDDYDLPKYPGLL